MARVNPFPPGVDDLVGSESDSVRYVVPLSSFERPRFYVIGGGEFEWPMGTEEMSMDGAATLAEHKFVSDNASVIQVTHREAGSIEMAGMFPGKTGPENMRALRQLCVQVDPPDGKRLEIPGIFNQAQKVVADTWRFNTVIQEDKWGIAYAVTFKIIGIKSPQTQIPSTPVAPTGPKGNPKGSTVHQFSVVKGIQTLRLVSNKVYGDPDRWKEIYEANKTTLSKLYPNALISSMPTKVLPLGTKLKYA